VIQTSCFGIRPKQAVVITGGVSAGSGDLCWFRQTKKFRLRSRT
jgi:hypothetical protein